MTNDNMIAARNSALEIFERLTIMQSSLVRFNDRVREVHEADLRDELERLAHFLGFSVERYAQAVSPAVSAQVEEVA